MLLKQLSLLGEAVVVYYSVNADALFQYARSGSIVRQFDPLLFDPGEGTALPEESGIGFDDGSLHPLPKSFLLIERLTGVRITEADLAESDKRIAVGLLF